MTTTTIDLTTMPIWNGQLVEITAHTANGKAFLRMQVDRDDPPTHGKNGKTFITFTPKDFANLKLEATLAGLNLVELDEGTRH